MADPLKAPMPDPATERFQGIFTQMANPRSYAGSRPFSYCLRTSTKPRHPSRGQGECYSWMTAGIGERDLACWTVTRSRGQWRVAS